jgi:hypothetical protein
MWCSRLAAIGERTLLSSQANRTDCGLCTRAGAAMRSGRFRFARAFRATVSHEARRQPVLRDSNHR